MTTPHFSFGSPSAGRFGDAEFYSFELPETPEGVCGRFTLPPFEKFLAQKMMGQWWSTPVYGTREEEIPEETLLLYLTLGNGGFAVCMPLFDGDPRAALKGTPDGVELRFDGAVPPYRKTSAELLAYAEGPDPFTPLDRILGVLRNRRDTFRFREEKSVPAFLKEFGWCTWNAFYRELNTEKIVSGLESFAEGGAAPGFLIIDDGWQPKEKEKPTPKLTSFQADPEKFPDGLLTLSQFLKRKYHLRFLGVWHTLNGYWHGLAPVFREKYRMLENEFNPYPPEHEPVWEELRTPEPEEAGRFFEDYHEFLSKNGVDLVKVDNQSYLSRFCFHRRGRVSTMAAYQKGLQDSALKHFGNGLISCMCHMNEIMFHLKTGNVFRNSEDYTPENKLEKQHYHLHANAKNAVLYSRFAVPDWDMFQSHALYGEAHAAARALSGGPVYVSDLPGKQDFSVLAPLFGSEGELLRPDGIALPTEDCFFADVQTEEVLLKIRNTVRGCGVLAAFHCCDRTERVLEGTAKASDLSDIPGEKFAVFRFRDKTVRIAARNEGILLSVPPDGCELLTFAPISEGFAVIGDPDKYLPPAENPGILRHGETLDLLFRTAKGRTLFYSERTLEPEAGGTLVPGPCEHWFTLERTAKKALLRFQ